VVAVHCEMFADSKSGTPGADNYKVKGNIHWLSAQHACKAQIRLYDRLFAVPHPGTERDFLADINPKARQTTIAFCEPSLENVRPEERFQFERHGYFIADVKDSTPGAPVFNRSVTLRDSWGKPTP
jgi:glutaminyl-tRNA synthetase